MAAFKDELDASAAQRLARELAAAWPEFPRSTFVRGLSTALEPLELLARGDHLADRLVTAMPDRFDEAAGVLLRALESTTFQGWIVLPCGGFVARAGIHHPDVALPLLAAMTSRWSSEFAIRPFIERHRSQTYVHLHRWLGHEDEHVRRLVSEGTRPRLPWAPRLRFLADDPSPNVPLLDSLVEDVSPYVRRSVANHLNDIARDHPDLALEIARRWTDRGDAAASVVRHGLRTLVKRGDRRAFEVLGVGDDPVELRDLRVDRTEVEVGAEIELSFALALPAAAQRPVEAIIDYRIHYVGARGAPKGPKVFKLARRRLEPGPPVTIRRRHRFDHVSIRRIHPGRHRVDVQVNGQVLGSIDVDVRDTALVTPAAPTPPQQS